MSLSVKSSAKEDMFAQQTEAQELRVRKLCATIKAEYDRADASTQAAINAILDEAVVLCP